MGHMSMEDDFDKIWSAYIHNQLVAPVPTTFVDTLNLKYGQIWISVVFFALQTL